MKPKVSTGYLTPQAKKRMDKPKPKRSESNEALNVLKENSELFEQLMNCPVKRQIVLNLIASEKHSIEDFKKFLTKEQKKKDQTGSPLSKINKKYHCESPTALLRRRALEQQGRHNEESDKESDSVENRSSSRQSSVSSCPSPVPFDKLLDGVIAYVEIKGRDRDLSGGVKSVLLSLGATVRDNFTKDVTHVVFKDGSYTTYQTAKLRKVHLVSTLWVERTRLSKTRVPEKKCPVWGTDIYEHNMSALCSQMQRDYEEAIQEELQRSSIGNTPLCSSRALIERRRTIMTPNPSAAKMFSQQCSQDKEVETILNYGRKSCNFSNIISQSPPQSRVSSDNDTDSDLDVCIGGVPTKRKKDTGIINSVEDTSSVNLKLANKKLSVVDKNIDNMPNGSNMDLTNLEGPLYINESFDISVKENTPNISNASIYNKKTPKIKGNKRVSRSKSKSNLFTTPDNNLYKRQTMLLNDISSEKTNIFCGSKLSEDNELNHQFPNLTTAPLVPGNLKILSKNSCTTNTNPVEVQNSNVTESVPCLQLSNEVAVKIAEKSISTNMSSLHVSANSNKEKNKEVGKIVLLTSSSSNHISNDFVKEKDKATQSNNNKRNISDGKLSSVTENLTSTDMSLLQISNDSEKDKVNRTSKKVSNNLSSLNMSPLEISCDSSKRKSRKSGGNKMENLETVQRNIEKLNGPLTRKKSNSLTRVKESTNTSNTSTNCSFSPLNANIFVHVLDILDNKNLNDENVTKRRTRRSVCTTPYVTRSKSVLPHVDNKIDSEEVSSAEKSIRRSRKTTTPNSSEKDLCSKNLKINPDTSDSKNMHLQTKQNDNKKSISKKGKSFENNSQVTENSKDISTNLNKSFDDSESDSSKKLKRLRKLYNPEDSIKGGIENDEKERECKRTEVKKRVSREGIILHPEIISVAPNILLTAKAKQFMDKNDIDLQKVLSTESEESGTDAKKKASRKKLKNNTQQKKISVNSDDDEQQELAKEFIKGKIDKKSLSNKKSLSVAKSTGRISKRRQSQRLSQFPRKKLSFNNSTSSSDEKNIVTPVVNRRSTMEFQKISQSSSRKKLKIDKAKQPSIVCTKFHKDEIQIFNQIVKKLGGFVIEDEVSRKTTHLVAGEPKRTINMLRAIATGCWILKKEWLLKSLEEGKWLPEEDYEQTNFSPAVQQCRLQRQAFGSSFSMDIFESCGPIYIAKGSIPRCSDLRELVSLCKGHIVTIPRNAKIVVGEHVRYENLTCVKETWLLDSITYNKKMPLKKYILQPDTKSAIV